ncbi:MAG: sensor domain-containing protein, partial [Burkholderiaceae bacterium]
MDVKRRDEVPGEGAAAEQDGPTHAPGPAAQGASLAEALDALAETTRRAAELGAQADESERRLRLHEAVLQNTPDLVYVFDLEHRFTYANEVLLQMWGRSWDDAIGKTCLELGYEPWHAAMHGREIEQVKATKRAIRGEVPFHGTFGRRIYDYIFAPVLGPDGEVEAIAGTTRDVTERKQAEEALRASESRQKFLVRLVDILRLTSDTGLLQAKAAGMLGEHLGASRVAYAEVEDDDRGFLVHEDWRLDGMPSAAGRRRFSDYGAHVAETLLAGRTLVVDDVRAVVGDAAQSADLLAAYDAVKTYAYVAVPIVRNGRIAAWLSVDQSTPRQWQAHEITLIEEVAERTWKAIDLANAEARVRHASLHDPLTGLPNRAMLFEYAGRLLPHNRRTRQGAAVLFLDLDRFKPINDTHGHEAGDAVLREVAGRLSGALRAEDIVIRLGGDEFVVLLQDVESAAYAGELANHLIERIGEPCQVGELSLSLSASVGISMFPADAEEIGELIGLADMAMYQAKQAGRNNFQFYSQDCAAAARLQLAIEQQLKSALRSDAFHLCYQPVLDIATGEIVNVEALLRWQNADIGPDRFVPVAEASGIINPIG